MIQHNKVT